MFYKANNLSFRGIKLLRRKINTIHVNFININMETNKKIIYIVTAGEYSDYHICAVFSTKEKAEEYVQCHGTDYNIEEYNLDEEVVKKAQLWSVAFSVEDCKMRFAYPTTQYLDKRDCCHINKNYTKEINFYVESDSMDRAIKIARERFAAVKANDYIWLRLTRPYEIDRYGLKKYEIFNVKTNEFIKEI